MKKFSKLLESYIETALWSSVDDAGNSLADNYSIYECDKEFLEACEGDIERFIEACGDLLDDIPNDKAMHDFWLTRNRHGAGFWCRGLGGIGEKLTEIALSFGEVDLFINDNKEVDKW